MSRTLWLRVILAAIVAISFIGMLTDRSIWSVAPLCGVLLGLSLVLGAGVGVAVGVMSAITHHSARAGVLLFRRILVHTGVSASVGISIGWLLGKPYDITPTIHNVPEAFTLGGVEKALILIVCWFLSLIAALISLRVCPP